VAPATPFALPAKQATTTIPVVFQHRSSRSSMREGRPASQHLLTPGD
jgi:hypothetical protein